MNAPPSLEEKYRYLKTNRGWFFLCSGVSLITLSTGMLAFCLQNHVLWLFLPFTLFLLSYLAISFFIGILGRDFIPLRVYALKFPTIDIYLPCCGEPLEILEATYEAVSKLIYKNHKIYVLDDTGAAKDMAQRYGFNYICRPEPREWKKAGNLRFAFSVTQGEFIIIFDADFCPRPEFIREMLPYMADDVAIVQSPQFFSVKEAKTWVSRGSSFIQILFYKMIQVNRDRWGAAICVGTNAIYRRSALQPYGGPALIDYSEDVHTGFNCIKSGWKIKYIPINLAKGLCPDSPQSFFNQQYRWAMGSITLCMNPEFWTTKLGIMRRLCYLSGMFYYITTGLGLFITPLPALTMLWFFPEHVIWYSTFFSIPSFLFATIGIGYWSKERWGYYVVKSRVLSYYSHLFALINKLSGDKMEWIPSGLEVKSNARYHSAMKICFWFNSALGVALISACIWNFKELGLNVIPSLFFQFFYIIASFSLAAESKEIC